MGANMDSIFYVAESGSFLFKKAGQSVGASGSQQLLLGGRLHVDMATEDNGWVKASTVPDKKTRHVQALSSSRGFRRANS